MPKILRRDFLNGVALVVGAAITPDIAAAAGAIEPYPPRRTGLRGSHPGSFEAAHALRDGALSPERRRPTGEHYDLIIVGAGISGLAAAFFWGKQHQGARILILDNHDDFGGHAKRNEFILDGKMHLMNGGTLEIDSPRPYSPASAGLLTALGIEPVALSKACNRPEVYKGLDHAVFFDKETFGADKLVRGGSPYGFGIANIDAFLAQTPLSERGRTDVRRIERDMTDPWPASTDAEKKDRLSRLSYRDFLIKVHGAGPEAAAFYQARTHGYWGVGCDAVSALDCWGMGYSGFQGLKLKRGSGPRMSFTPAGYADTGGSPMFHFPDGNATIARRLVQALIPEALAPGSVADSIGARVDYGALDRPGAAVRLRLNSLAIGVRHLEAGRPKAGVAVVYRSGAEEAEVTADRCILACWNMMIPYLCPELPEPQKAALHQIIKTPLVYTSVAITNWRAFKALGVSSVHAPGCYHTSLHLNRAVDIGAVSAERSPDKPVLVHMVRTPCSPGLPEFDQNRAGRAELLATPFETFEREIRAQLQRTLGPGGFDHQRDIRAITVNRWPHGYAPEWNPLWEEPLPEAQQPNVIGRQRFGAIAIANSDAGAAAYTDSAIDQAWRAVNDLAGV
jgi:spermidine dehydrogenase